LKKKAFFFFLFIAITIIATASAIYIFFYMPVGLSSAETANRLQSIYSRTVFILNFMSDDMIALANRSITPETFWTRMTDLKTSMTALRTELTEVRKIAFPAYVQSIDLLDRGLQSYVDALSYAHDLNFNQTRTYLLQGTDYVTRSQNALPLS
jgi:hypothetical protein